MDWTHTQRGDTYAHSQFTYLHLIKLQSLYSERGGVHIN